MSDEMWANNEVRFARLLCEIAATQPDMDLIETADSMGLSMDEVTLLFDRAHEVWEAAKARIPKAEGRRFHRVVFQFEMLTDAGEAFAHADFDLEDIHYHTYEGGCSGQFLGSYIEEVDGPTMARLLENQNSDPGIFQLSENGEELCWSCEETKPQCTCGEQGGEE